MLQSAAYSPLLLPAPVRSPPARATSIERDEPYWEVVHEAIMRNGDALVRELNSLAEDLAERSKSCSSAANGLLEDLAAAS